MNEWTSTSFQNVQRKIRNLKNLKNMRDDRKKVQKNVNTD